MTSSTHSIAERLWNLTDKFRNIAQPAELASALASLVCLRCLSEQQGENFAFGADGAVAVARWHQITAQESGLVEYLREQVAPALDAEVGVPELAPLATVLRRLADLGNDATNALVDQASTFRVSEPAEAAALGEALGDLAVGGGRSGDGNTPGAVTELMALLASANGAKKLHDPCFGAAGLLTRCALDAPDAEISGLEIDIDSYVVGMCRLLLAGVRAPTLRRADALAEAEKTEYDCIVAHPPWGRGQESAFVAHVMQSLGAEGRAVVAVPEGFLFSKHARQTRERLVTAFTLDGVISLPVGSFRPHTAAKSSLLVFRNAGPTERVRFVSASSLDESTGQSPQDLYQLFQSADDGDSTWSVSLAGLAARDYELVARESGARTLDGALRLLDDVASIDVVALDDACDITMGVHYRTAETRQVSESPHGTRLIRVGDIGKLGRVTPSLALGLVFLKDDKLVKEGDVLLSVSGTIGKVAVADEALASHATVPARAIAKIRVKDDRGLRPDFLAQVLRSEIYQTWLYGHAAGATIKHLSVPAIRNLRIPIPSSEIQRKVANSCEEHGGDALQVLHEFVSSETWLGPIARWLMTAPEVEAVHSLRNRQAHGAATATDAPLAVIDAAIRSLPGSPANDEQHLHIPVFRDSSAEEIRDRMSTLRQRSEGATLAGSAQPWRREDGPADTGRLVRWQAGFAKGTACLDGIADVPDSDALVAAIGQALLNLQQLQSVVPLSRGVPAEARAAALVDALLGILRAVIGRVVDVAHGVLPKIAESFVVRGVASDVTIELTNNATTSLRNVRLFVEGAPPLAESALLRAGERLEATMQLAGGESDHVLIDVYVTAQSLTGKPFRVSSWLKVDVTNGTAPLTSIDPGDVPYIAGQPIPLDRPEMFFGRTELLERIKRQIAGRHTSVVLLEGNRRTGKTSVLKRLMLPTALPGWVVVYCSFQRGEGHASKVGLETREVFRLLAKQIGDAAHAAGFTVPFPGMEVGADTKHFPLQLAKALGRAFSDSNPFELLETYLAEILTTMRAGGQRLLLLLDEFDKIQQGIENGATSPQVPENLRYLFQAHDDMACVISGSKRLKTLRQEYWSALFGLGLQESMSALTLEEARALVVTPVEGRLVFSRAAVQKVVELCACHPFIIQYLCTRIVHLAVAHGTSHVGLGLVDKAAELVTQQNEHFAHLWESLPSERMRLLLLLCEQLSDGPDPITLELLERSLIENDVPFLDDEAIGTDLLELQENELITLRSGASIATYQLRIPLMGIWLDSHQDFERQRRRAISESEANL